MKALCGGRSILRRRNLFISVVYVSLSLVPPINITTSMPHDDPLEPSNNRAVAKFWVVRLMWGMSSQRNWVNSSKLGSSWWISGLRVNWLLHCCMWRSMVSMPRSLSWSFSDNLLETHSPQHRAVNAFILAGWYYLFSKPRPRVFRVYESK